MALFSRGCVRGQKLGQEMGACQKNWECIAPYFLGCCKEVTPNQQDIYLLKRSMYISIESCSERSPKLFQASYLACPEIISRVFIIKLQFNRYSSNHLQQDVTNLSSLVSMNMWRFSKPYFGRNNQSLTFKVKVARFCNITWATRCLLVQSIQL